MLLVSCGDPKKPPTGPGSGSVMSPDTDDAVLEAVYLHEIAAAGVKPDESLCLRVRDAAGKTGDASVELIAAIAKKHPKAVAASACSGGGMDPVKSGDGPAVMFDIGPVKRDGGAIRVEGGGGHRGGGSIREVEYTVERKDGAFRVANERVLREN
jgi:hypothetical protein